MNKNIIIAAILSLVIIETGYLIYRHTTKSAIASNAPARGTKPVFLSKGSNLTTSALKQYAYQIAPGVISDATKQKLTGFTITSVTNPDGSTSVSLTPKDSEDQHQQYTVKTGQMLYFIEQTPMDDKADSDRDLNYRDDYGIITDANGIVQ